jgi:hypothetical protein
MQQAGLSQGGSSIFEIYGPGSRVAFEGTSKAGGPRQDPIAREGQLRDFRQPDHIASKERLNQLKVAVGDYADQRKGFSWTPSAFGSSYFCETEPRISRAAQREGYAPLLAAEDMRQKEGASNQRYVENFRTWLRGRQFAEETENEEVAEMCKRTPFYRAHANANLMRLPGVADYFDSFVEVRAEFERKLTKLILRGPTDFISSWYYYKFVVNGVAADRDEQLQFIQSYDTDPVDIPQNHPGPQQSMQEHPMQDEQDDGASTSEPRRNPDRDAKKKADDEELRKLLIKLDKAKEPRRKRKAEFFNMLQKHFQDTEAHRQASTDTLRRIEKRTGSSEELAKAYEGIRKDLSSFEAGSRGREQELRRILQEREGALTQVEQRLDAMSSTQDSEGHAELLLEFKNLSAEHRRITHELKTAREESEKTHQANLQQLVLTLSQRENPNVAEELLSKLNIDERVKTLIDSSMLSIKGEGDKRLSELSLSHLGEVAKIQTQLQDQTRALIGMIQKSGEGQAKALFPKIKEMEEKLLTFETGVKNAIADHVQEQNSKLLAIMNQSKMTKEAALQIGFDSSRLEDNLRVMREEAQTLAFDFKEHIDQYNADLRRRKEEQRKMLAITDESEQSKTQRAYEKQERKEQKARRKEQEELRREAAAAQLKADLEEKARELAEQIEELKSRPSSSSAPADPELLAITYRMQKVEDDLAKAQQEEIAAGAEVRPAKRGRTKKFDPPPPDTPNITPLEPSLVEDSGIDLRRGWSAAAVPLVVDNLTEEEQQILQKNPAFITEYQQGRMSAAYWVTQVERFSTERSRFTEGNRIPAEERENRNKADRAVRNAEGYFAFANIFENTPNYLGKIARYYTKSPEQRTLWLEEVRQSYAALAEAREEIREIQRRSEFQVRAPKHTPVGESSELADDEVVLHPSALLGDDYEPKDENDFGLEDDAPIAGPSTSASQATEPTLTEAHIDQMKAHLDATGEPIPLTPEGKLLINGIREGDFNWISRVKAIENAKRSKPKVVADVEELISVLPQRDKGYFERALDRIKSIDFETADVTALTNQLGEIDAIGIPTSVEAMSRNPKHAAIATKLVAILKKLRVSLGRFKETRGVLNEKPRYQGQK